MSASARSKLTSAAVVSRPSARSPARVRNRERRRFQLGSLLRLAGGAGEVERGRVVVGEHVGVVADAVAGLRLDPARRGHVAGGP